MVKPRRQNYRLLDHTADLGLEIFGADPAALFINAGHALFEMLVQRKTHARHGPHRRAIDVKGEDWADLMINWLRELLYLFNGDQLVVLHIEMVSLAPTDLKAMVACEDFSPQRHSVEQEIKAVTYHQVQVGPQETGWRARVVFDV